MAWSELSTGLALLIGDRSHLEDVTVNAVIAETTRWGLGERAARRLTDETVAGVREAALGLRDRGPVADSVANAVATRAKRFA